MIRWSNAKPSVATMIYRSSNCWLPKYLYKKKSAFEGGLKIYG